MSRVWEIFDDEEEEDGGIEAEDDAFLHHPAIEVSLDAPLHRLRQMAVDACPPQSAPGALLAAQRALLRSGAARLSCKGLSADSETYRRLGILVPPYRYPADFARALAALRDYWQHHGRARSLGHAAPYRRVQQRAARYLRLRAGIDHDGGGGGRGGGGGDCGVPDPESLLPTPTDVRVFRLVNGNLEIPPTLFKALSCAGRLEDTFFPDEPATWGKDGGGSCGRVPRAMPEAVVKDEGGGGDDGGSGGGSGRGRNGRNGGVHGNVIDLTWGDDDDDYEPPRPRRGRTSTVDLTVYDRPASRAPIRRDDWVSSSRSSRSNTALRAAHRAASAAAPVFVFSPTIQVMPSLFGGAEDGRGSSRHRNNDNRGSSTVASTLTDMFDSFRSFVTTAAAIPAAGAAPAELEPRSTLLLEQEPARNRKKRRDRVDDKEGWQVSKRGRFY